MYKIRAAEATDYPVINRLNRTDENMQLKANDSIIEEDFYYKSLQHLDSNWFLVEKSGEVKAFIFLTMDRTNKVIEVKKFIIDHNDRKKGLIDHLYKKLEQVATWNEMTSLKIGISENHLDVIDFFERNGWIKENRWYVLYIK